MQDSKWLSKSDSVANYIPLSHPPYAYHGDYQSSVEPHLIKNEIPSHPSLPVSPPLPSNLMSIPQPATPRPEAAIHTPPSSEKLAVSPNLIRKRPSLPSRSTDFTTTTFHSNPYPSTSPVRRRRTESIFTFEMGPTFSSTKQFYDLYSMDQTNSYQVQLHAKMDRGFFKADQDWTCYRRNYFQVSATFDIHGLNYMLQGLEVPCLLRKQDTQELLQVEYFSIGISARVTIHDKKIELVQHTPKRDKGPQKVPDIRAVRAGGNLHLASVGTNHNIVTFERLQFKTATANNGKRRAAQQYYEIVVDLYANFARDEPIKVASCTSSPLVVRGRSPGHYSDSYTRFRNIETDIPIQNGNTSPVAVGGTLNEERFGLSHPPLHSPNHRYPSLPNSPISEFGPYSPYNNYPYNMTAYSTMMPAPGLSQYAPPPTSTYFSNDQTSPPQPTYNNSTSSYPREDAQLNSDQKLTYWKESHIPRIRQPSENSSHYTSNNNSISNNNDNHQHSNNNNHEPMYIGANAAYGHISHNNNGPYPTGLDAGRLK